MLSTSLDFGPAPAESLVLREGPGMSGNTPPIGGQWVDRSVTLVLDTVPVQDGVAMG